MRSYVSPSQLMTYLACSLKFYFRYAERRPPERVSAALAFGKSMHSALASHHEAVRDGTPLTLAEVQNLWRADFLAETTEALVYAKTESPETLLALGNDLIAEYIRTCRFEVIGVEHGFQVPLCDPDTGEILVEKPLHGIYDLLTPGGIVEFKTAKSTMAGPVLERSLQISAYVFAFEFEFGHTPDVTLVHLLKLKKPRVEKLVIRREPNDIRFFLRTAQAVSRGIESGVFAPNPSWQCAGCEYADACRKWPTTTTNTAESFVSRHVHSRMDA